MPTLKAGLKRPGRCSGDAPGPGADAEPPGRPLRATCGNRNMAEHGVRSMVRGAPQGELREESCRRFISRFARMLSARKPLASRAVEL